MTTFAAPDAPEALTSAGHEHAWQLVQVHYSDGCCVREFGCSSCPAVWFS